MKLSIRKAVVAISAATLVLGLTACSEQERAFFQSLCTDQPDACKTLPASDAAPAERIKATAVQPANGPAALQTWIEDHRLSDEADSAHLSAADLTYITIAGGLRPTGGYRVEVSEAVREGDLWVIEARVVAPEPGSMVTMAMTNPTALVRFPSLDGEIKVRLAGAPGASDSHLMLNSTRISDLTTPENAEISVETTWMPDNILNVTGNVMIDAADLHFEVRKGTTVLAQADAQVRDAGYYVTNLIVAGGATEGLTLVVSTVEPGGGKVLITRELRAD